MSISGALVAVALAGAATLAGCAPREDVAEMLPSSSSDTVYFAGQLPGRAVLTATRTGAIGPYLADPIGRALYLFAADTGGVSTCYGRCAEIWPPYLSLQGKPAARGREVRPELLGTAERRDSAPQVTYGGQPLYYYVRDEGLGSIRGQGVRSFGGAWYLVAPEGKPLTPAPAP